jgi:hypothetical protein
MLRTDMVTRNLETPAEPPAPNRQQRRAAERGKPDPLEYYDMAEAAAIARRSENAMRLLRAKGRGPRFVKTAGRLLVSGAELERWLDSGED